MVFLFVSSWVFYFPQIKSSWVFIVIGKITNTFSYIFFIFPVLMIAIIKWKIYVGSISYFLGSIFKVMGPNKFHSIIVFKIALQRNWIISISLALESKYLGKGKKDIRYHKVTLVWHFAISSNSVVWLLKHHFIL